MATIIKPTGNRWSKVVEVGGEAEGGEVKQQPPMAPSAFAALLETLTFTNGSDREVVRNLYQQTMEDGFGGLTELNYDGLGWGDAEVAQLSATLEEVNCVGVVKLNLNNKQSSARPMRWAMETLETLYLPRCTSLSLLPDSIGQLKALETLDLRNCTSLSLLPDSIGQLKALGTLNLRECTSLSSLPDSIGQLKALETLNLRVCTGLSSLPDSIGQLEALRKLDLRKCTSLSSLPDFSSLPQLRVYK
jgi:Leucine-rich repeat (LRR) protein